jgi:hypothetical protein
MEEEAGQGRGRTGKRTGEAGGRQKTGREEEEDNLMKQG